MDTFPPKQPSTRLGTLAEVVHMYLPTRSDHTESQCSSIYRLPHHLRIPAPSIAYSLPICASSPPLHQKRSPIIIIIIDVNSSFYRTQASEHLLVFVQSAQISFHSPSPRIRTAIIIDINASYPKTSTSHIPEC